MIKSASTFTFYLLNEIIREYCFASNIEFIEAKNLAPDVGILNGFINRDSNLKKFKETLYELDPEFRRSRHIVVKTHQPKSFFADIFREDEMIVFANFRHPAEIALSLRDAAKKDKELEKGRFEKYETFEAALGQVPFQIKCFESWNNAERIFYDDLARNPNHIFQRILDKLNFDYLFLETARKLHGEKEGLPEFNIGRYGRRFEELTNEILKEIEDKFSNFIDEYIN